MSNRLTPHHPSSPPAHNQQEDSLSTTEPALVTLRAHLVGVLPRTGLMPLTLLLVEELEHVKRHVDAVTLRNMSDLLLRRHQVHESPIIIEFIVNAGAVVSDTINIDGAGGTRMGMDMYGWGRKAGHRRWV